MNIYVIGFDWDESICNLEFLSSEALAKERIERRCAESDARFGFGEYGDELLRELELDRVGNQELRRCRFRDGVWSEWEVKL